MRRSRSRGVLVSGSDYVYIEPVNSSPDEEVGFVTKGNDVTRAQLMAASSINGDQIIVNLGSDQVYTGSRANIRENMADLAKLASTPIHLLNDKSRGMMESVSSLLYSVRSLPVLYESLNADVQSIFGGVHPVFPGTVGAFFMGCQTEDNWTGTPGCNPKCANSFAPNGEMYTCNSSVFHYEESEVNGVTHGVLHMLHKSESPHAYIYVKPGFKMMYHRNVKCLRDIKITDVTLIQGVLQGNNINYEMGEPVKIEDLPVYPLTNLEKMPTDDVTTMTEDDVYGGSTWMWAIGIGALLLLLILAILYLYGG